MNKPKEAEELFPVIAEDVAKKINMDSIFPSSPVPGAV